LGKLVEILLVLGAISLFEIYRRRRFTDALLLLFWLHLMLHSARNASLGAVIVIPIIANNCTSLIKEARLLFASDPNRNSWARCALKDLHEGILAINKQLNGALFYASALLSIAVLVYSANEGIGLTKQVLPSQFDKNLFPVNAAEFVSASLEDQKSPFNQIFQGNLFSSDYYGGYLIYRLYPRLRVFMDGRSDFYWQGGIVNDALKIMRLKPDVADVLDKHKIQWLLLPKDAAFSSWARVNPQWQSIYRDEKSEIFLRKERN
jgi:hypothetical protein